MKLLERIVLDPEIMGGKPTIRGTRITVGTILNQLRFQSREELLQDYPELTPEDIDAKYNLGFVKYSLGKEKVEEACGIFRELVLTGRLITQLEEKEKEEISLLLTKEKGKSAIPLPPEIASSIGNGNFVYIYLFDTLSPFLSPLPPATLENLYLLLGASYVRVADLKKEKGYYDSAITSFQRVIILNPENTDAYQNLVVAYREKGDKKMAEKMYLKMEEIKKRKGQK